MIQMTHQVLTGEEFNEKYKNYEFYKLLNKDLTNYGFTYKNGLNVDVNKFNPTGKCLIGGLYFTEKDNIYFWIGMDLYFYITKVIIPNDAHIYVETNKFKSDKLIVDVDNKISISEYHLWNDEEFCKKVVRFNGYSLRYVKEQTEEICKLAVRNNGYALIYVKEQTEEICKLAVKSKAHALEYVKEQTKEICELAVNQDGYVLKYVKKQTEDLCKLAVKENGNALEYVKEQTEDICKIALKQNGYALQYVKNKKESLKKLAKQQKRYLNQYK